MKESIASGSVTRVSPELRTIFQAVKKLKRTLAKNERIKLTEETINRGVDELIEQLVLLVIQQNNAPFDLRNVSSRMRDTRQRRPKDEEHQSRNPRDE